MTIIVDLDDPQSVMQVLQEKVGSRTRGGFDQLRKISKLFGRNKGIDPPHFRRIIKSQFGLRLTREQASRVFQVFDENGNGLIETKEFLAGPHPPRAPPRPYAGPSEKAARQRAKAGSRVNTADGRGKATGLQDCSWGLPLSGRENPFLVGLRDP